MLSAKTFAACFRELLNTDADTIDLSNLTSIAAIYTGLTLSTRTLIERGLVNAGDLASLPPSPDRATNGLGLLIRAINQNPKIKRIEKLTLANCNLGDADLLNISRLTKPIGTLDLADNNITLEGCSYLIRGLWDDTHKKATFERLSLLIPKTPLADKFPLAKLASYTAGKEQRYRLQSVQSRLSSSRTGTYSTALSMAQADSAANYGTNPLNAINGTPTEPTIYVSGAEDYVHFIKDGTAMGGRGAGYKFEDDASAGAGSCCCVVS